TVAQRDADSVVAVRRLLVFVSVVVAVDTLFFTALTPLLPHFADKYDLSKAGAGVFISTYAAGTLVGAIPAGLATTRFGPKRTVLAGLALMTAASLGFALAGNVWALGAARLFQGIGSSFSWAGGLAWVIASTPRERRGALLGTAMGAAVFGALFVVTTAVETVLNPLLGRLTDRQGRLRPVRAALIGSIVVSVALAWARQPALIAVLVVASGIAYGSFYTPGLALISHGAESAGLAQGLAFGVMNACWGIGALIGPAAGGALAGAAGDSVPYLLLAGICLATWIATRVRYAEPVGDLQ